MKKSLFFLFILLTFTTTISAQTLADYARQQRERKGNTGSTVTYTNESLRPATVQPAQPVEAAPTPGATAAEVKPEVKDTNATAVPEAKSDATAQKPVRDEKYWRNLFTEARAELTRAENQVKVQELRVNQAQKDLLQRSDIYNKEQTLGQEVNAAIAALDAARKNVEQVKLKISTLEEDLRRSGAPAGWAR